MYYVKITATKTKKTNNDGIIPVGRQVIEIAGARGEKMYAPESFPGRNTARKIQGWKTLRGAKNFIQYDMTLDNTEWEKKYEIITEIITM